MKKSTFFLLTLFTISFAFAQDKTRARVVFIKPKPDMVAEFEKGLAAHVQKFHAKATDPVTVFKVTSGKRTGEYHFVQGPYTWADMAAIQYAGDHSDDWRKNVSKYVVSEEVHYYNYLPEYSHNVTQEESEWSTLAFVTLHGGTINTYQQLLKTRMEALGKAKDSRNTAVYAHSFAGRDNEHNYAFVSALRGGLKDLDSPPAPLNKVLTDQIGPNAAVDDSKGVDQCVKKTEAMLIRRMADLSSK